MLVRTSATEPSESGAVLAASCPTEANPQPTQPAALDWQGRVVVIFGVVCFVGFGSKLFFELIWALFK
jgi:hypothetical protein